MMEYHKITTLFDRDPNNNFKTLLEGHWAKPEFAYLASNFWKFTEKVDGTNVRVIWNGEEVLFAGRTDRAEMPAPLLDHLRETFTAEKFLHASLPSLTLYGEGFGPKIQNGGRYGDSVRFVGFDVWFGSRLGRWAVSDVVDEVCDMLSVPMVQPVSTGSLLEMVELVRDGHLRSAFGDFEPEGLVARPAIELVNNYGDRIITKLKHKDFAR